MTLVVSYCNFDGWYVPWLISRYNNCLLYRNHTSVDRLILSLLFDTVYTQYLQQVFHYAFPIQMLSQCWYDVVHFSTKQRSMNKYLRLLYYYWYTNNAFPYYHPRRSIPGTHILLLIYIREIINTYVHLDIISMDRIVHRNEYNHYHPNEQDL